MFELSKVAINGSNSRISISKEFKANLGFSSAWHPNTEKEKNDVELTHPKKGDF